MASTKGSIFGRALGVAITYLVLGAMWDDIVAVTQVSLGGLEIVAQVGLGLFVAILPFVAFAPELKGLF